MDQYIAAIPAGGELRKEIQAFYKDFYRISDSPDLHEQYADMFTKDGKLIIGSAESNGRDEIIKMRHGMWEKVAKRSHRPGQLFPFGAGSNDVMLYGTVDYEFKDGKTVSVEWAAHSKFTSSEGGLRMEFYQVFLDSAVMARAK